MTTKPQRLARLALLLALGGALAGLVAAVGSGAGLWSFRPAFTALRWAFYVAAAGGVLALGALLWSLARQRRAVLPAAIALVTAAGYCGTVASWAGEASRVPPIHDVTTDLADPPRFRTLPLRADNLETVPDGDDPALAALSPTDRLAELQRRAYPDLTPVRLTVSPEQAQRLVAELMRARGWTIAANEPGRLEATDTVSLFRFKDDVIARIRPAPGGSTVDLRSVSRVGVSDLGVNARRVREFAADLRSEGAG